MIVITGPIASTDAPPAAATARGRARRPRPRRSPAATEKLTVALTLIPRAVASSIASHPGRGGRELHDDVRGERHEALGLGDHGGRVAEEGGIGLHRQPAGVAARGLEGRQQQWRGEDAHLGDDGPRQLALRPGRVLGGEGRHAIGPARRVRPPVVDHDGGVRGRADGTERDGVRELVDVAAVVPDVSREAGDGAAERRVGEGRSGQGHRGYSTRRRCLRRPAAAGPRPFRSATARGRSRARNTTPCGRPARRGSRRR